MQSLIFSDHSLVEIISFAGNGTLLVITLLLILKSSGKRKVNFLLFGAMACFSFASLFPFLVVTDNSDGFSWLFRLEIVVLYAAHPLIFLHVAFVKRAHNIIGWEHGAHFLLVALQLVYLFQIYALNDQEYAQLFNRSVNEINTYLVSSSTPYPYDYLAWVCGFGLVHLLALYLHVKRYRQRYLKRNLYYWVMYLIISLGVFDGLYITFHLLQTEGVIALATEQDLFLLAFTIVFMILVSYLIYKPFTLTVDQQAVNKDLTRRKGIRKHGRYGNTENNISI
mgnify:FL=1